MTIVVLYRGKCGLTKCVTCYLVAMAVADLLSVILDLILRHIPIVCQEQFNFVRFIPVCNIHAVLLYAARDFSVWFTVTFTLDRLVAISCLKLKINYRSEKKKAAVVLGIVTVLSCLKNMFWYFMLKSLYLLMNAPWFFNYKFGVMFSPGWITVEFLHYMLNPCDPFVMILLLNMFTVRHVLVSSRARRRLRAHNNGEIAKDPELESRRKSIILLFVISANLIILWLTIMVYYIWNQMSAIVHTSVWLHDYIMELGFMLQTLSCCTNTIIYAVTQTKFRKELKNVLMYPFIHFLRFKYQ